MRKLLFAVLVPVLAACGSTLPEADAAVCEISYDMAIDLGTTDLLNSDAGLNRFKEDAAAVEALIPKLEDEHVRRSATNVALQNGALNSANVNSGQLGKALESWQMLEDTCSKRAGMFAKR